MSFFGSIKSFIRNLLGRKHKVQFSHNHVAHAYSGDTQIDEHLKSQLWAIGGGKGGVGKSLVSVMLGSALTRWGKKVVLVDADLGGSNLHTLTGIHHPQYTLADFMNGKVKDIEKIALDTPVNNLRVICGADDILGIANPKSAQKARLFNQLKKLKADIILLDLGAGTSYTTLDFFLFAPHKIVLLTPQSTSIQNAYGFVKTCLFRKLTREFRRDAECMNLIFRCNNSGGEEKINTVVRLKKEFAKLGEERENRLSACIEELRMGLLVNMVRQKKEIQIGRSFIPVASDYLSITPEYLGFIEYDKRMDKSVNKMSDFLSDGTGNTVMTEMGFYDLANKLVNKMYKKSKGIKTGSSKVQKNENSEARTLGI